MEFIAVEELTGVLCVREWEVWRGENTVIKSTSSMS